jgi:hypothetical protein
MELVPVVDVLLLAADAHSLARSGQLLALESVNPPYFAAMKKALQTLELQ